MPNRSKILKKETKNEFEERICENMGNGFEWDSSNWSILKIVKGLEDDGELIDSNYQRKIVWESSRKIALIETILQHGGNKIPTITLRQITDKKTNKVKYEIVDGKQRLIGSIKPFVDNKFRLNGVYTPELRGYNLKEIKEEYPQIYRAFMNTSVPVQIAKNMSDEEAKLYFIQINESGVNMRIGEKIHAHQGTPLIKVIDDFKKHRLWECVGQIGRDNDYAYISRMLLHIRDTQENKYALNYYNNKQLMRELQQYLMYNIPSGTLTELKEDMDTLHQVICKNKCNLSITEMYPVFLYIHAHRKTLVVQKFQKFIKEFYEYLPSNKGVFNLFNNQKNKLRGSVKYWEWYLDTIDVLFDKFMQGVDWDELSRLQVNL